MKKKKTAFTLSYQTNWTGANGPKMQLMHYYKCQWEYKGNAIYWLALCRTDIFWISMTHSKQSPYLAGAPCPCWSEPRELAGAAPEPGPKLSSSGAAAACSELSHGALEYPLLTPRGTAKHKGPQGLHRKRSVTVERIQHEGTLNTGWRHETRDREGFLSKDILVV